MAPSHAVTPPDTFDRVLAAERSEIKERRRRHYADGTLAPDDRVEPDLVGLALSGGGIRSATFCLGLLQGLETLKLLRLFDYLSTVSGGGFAGGWWSAWLTRGALQARTLEALARELLVRRPGAPGDALVAALQAFGQDRSAANQAALEAAVAEELDVGARGLSPRPERLFPADEGLEPIRADHYVDDRMPDGALAAGADPIHHLRLFSNYLTPRKGLLSGDTWRGAAVVTRNLILTWLVLVPVLLAAILLGQLFFVWQQFVPSAAVQFIQPAGLADAGALGLRAAAVMTLLLPLLALQVLLVVVWMRFNNAGTSLTHWATLLAVALMIGGVVMMAGGRPASCDGFSGCLGQALWRQHTTWDAVMLAVSLTRRCHP